MALKRFTDAHDRSYEQALAEIKRGRKESHWMWYIFPQIQGLGRSETAKHYAIRDLDEAKAYMADEVLSKHMLTLCEALLELKSNNASEIFGWPDDMKLCSSMTLFSISNPECEVFGHVLDKFFGGKQDEKTVGLIK